MNEPSGEPIQKDTSAKVLIVDDGQYIRRLLSIPLRKKYEVIEAEGGAGALRSIEFHQPKVVLLDIMMPGVIDGLQVLDFIKSDPRFKDIRVAMVTARGQAKDWSIAQKRGADAYFVKPFSPGEVFAWG